MDFHQRKFTSLPIKQQHKKCAEILQIAYQLKVEEKEPAQRLQQYARFSCWMGLPCLSEDIKAISDRYHWHLKQAEQSLKEHRLLPQLRTKDRTVPKDSLLPLFIYLDHIRSAHNVGSIIRTAEAFSLGTLVFSEQTPFIDHKQVKDAAMGAHEWIPCKKNILLEQLPKPVIALETSIEAISIYDFDFPESFTLILGNEEYGCSSASLGQADALVEIPLVGRKNSLNVANAFAITASFIRKIYQNKSKIGFRQRDSFHNSIII